MLKTFRLIQNNPFLSYGGLALLIILGGLVLWAAPEEQTLGSGIKVVYLHVALIWTGMTGLVLLGILGIGVLLTGNQRLQTWGQAVGWVALGFFLAGILMSMLAAKVNWGGIFWQEPRYIAMFRVMAIAIISQVIGLWPISPRITGGLSAIPALILVWSVNNTALILHPQNPIQSSPSLAIQGTFLGLFGLCCLAAILLIPILNKE